MTQIIPILQLSDRSSGRSEFSVERNPYDTLSLRPQTLSLQPTPPYAVIRAVTLSSVGEIYQFR